MTDTAYEDSLLFQVGLTRPVGPSLERRISGAISDRLAPVSEVARVLYAGVVKQSFEVVSEDSEAWVMDGLELSPLLIPFEDEVLLSMTRIDRITDDGQMYDRRTWEYALLFASDGLDHIGDPDAVSYVEVSSGGDSSIDLVLTSGDRTLALNVESPDAELMFLMTCSRPDVLTQRGRLSPTESFEWLFDWLAADFQDEQ